MSYMSDSLSDVKNSTPLEDEDGDLGLHEDEDEDEDSDNGRHGNFITGSVSRVINPLIDCVDIDGVARRIDVAELSRRIDVADISRRIDINHILRRIDWTNDVVDRIDWNDILLQRIDLDRLIDRIDVERVVRRSKLHSIVAQSSKFGANLFACVARQCKIIQLTHVFTLPFYISFLMPIYILHMMDECSQQHRLEHVGHYACPSYTF